MEKRKIKALFAVSGIPEELLEFEELLKLKGINGVMSNEASRLLKLKWLVIYKDFAENDKKDFSLSYAYRATNCKHTSRPKVISLKTAKVRLEKGYYLR